MFKGIIAEILTVIIAWVLAGYQGSRYVPQLVGGVMSHCGNTA